MSERNRPVGDGGEGREIKKPLLCRMFGHKIYKDFCFFDKCLRCDTPIGKRV